MASNQKLSQVEFYDPAEGVPKKDHLDPIPTVLREAA